MRDRPYMYTTVNFMYFKIIIRTRLKSSTLLEV